MTYEQRLHQMRGDLRAMAQELIDATEDNAAHVALVAVIALKDLSNELAEYGLEDCEVAPVEGKSEKP